MTDKPSSREPRTSPLGPAATPPAPAPAPAPQAGQDDGPLESLGKAITAPVLDSVPPVPGEQRSQDDAKPKPRG